MNNNGPQNSILAGCAIILTVAILWMVANAPTPSFMGQPKPQPQQQNFQANYPINMEITSYIGKADLDPTFVPEGMGDKLVSVMHKVSYDEENHNYVYTYRISFLGKEKCFLSWALLDRILNDASIELPIVQNTSPYLIELHPNKVREFTLTTKEPPAIYEGFAWIYKKKTVVDENVVWELVKLNTQPGPLPKKAL